MCVRACVRACACVCACACACVYLQVGRTPGLKPCIVPMEKLHLTLFVMALNSDTTVQHAEARAHDALLQCADAATACFFRSGSWQPPCISLRGLGTFSTRVLFSQVEDAPGPSGRGSLGALVQFSHLCHQKFVDNGLVDAGQSSFRCVPCHGMVWRGMVLYAGMVRHGTVWYAIVWCGMVLCGGMVCHGMVWYALVWCGMVLYGGILHYDMVR